MKVGDTEGDRRRAGATGVAKQRHTLGTLRCVALNDIPVLLRVLIACMGLTTCSVRRFNFTTRFVRNDQ